MLSRSKRAELAKGTLEILNKGQYISPSGKVIDISSDLQEALSKTMLYRESDFPPVISFLNKHAHGELKIEVTGETTLEAARRVSLTSKEHDPLCLNFASAKNPGGGFLSGSQAQEESLARSSGLYQCLIQQKEMYDYNRQLKTCLYSDYMIYAPGVPVFRNDAGELLEEPYKISFITSPAVNAGAMKNNENHNIALIKPTMLRRLDRVLWVASENKHEELILGAWGCGVFGNDASMIASIFAESLGENGLFYKRFKRVVYAVYDRSQDQQIFKAFKDKLRAGT